MTRYVDQWMEAEDIGPFTQKGDEANKIKDLFIREQLLENSPSDIRTWLKERKPKSVKEMIELGDQYLASHLYHSGEGKIMQFAVTMFRISRMKNLTSRRKLTRVVTNAIKRGILRQIVSFNLLGQRKDFYPRKKDMSS